MKTIQKIIVFGLILTFIIGSVSTFPSMGGHGGTIYNGNLYKLFSISKTWAEAKADCETQGGHLVTITNSEENDFVISLISGADKVWIGLTDELTEGDWEWITGETSTYYNWDTNEPNGGTDENHAEIYSSGFWNDAPGDFDGNYYVCEWDNVEVTFNGHQYQLISTSKTWAEARADCEARGGHLVTISSSEENDFVSSLIESDGIWIGFTDELNEGDWQWVTGEDKIYTNWALDEPNDSGAGEDYVEMYGDGEWNDNGGPSDPALIHPYVCEWDIFSSKQNLIFHSPMNEGSGNTVYDQSGHSNDGTIFGAIWTKGKVGNALEFDGVDDYVEVAPPPDLSSGLLTISVWTFFDVAPDPTSDWRYGIICQDDFNTRIIQLNTFGDRFGWHRFDIGEQDLFSYNVTIEAHKWYHVAVTFDGTHYRLYIDGALNDEQPGSFYPNTTMPMIIGKHNAPEFPFDGIIDEVRIYNSSLSQDDIKQLAGVSNGEDGTDTSGTTATSATSATSGTTATTATSEKEDTSDNPSLVTPGFELVTWTISLFILIAISKIVRKSKNNRE